MNSIDLNERKDDDQFEMIGNLKIELFSMMIEKIEFQPTIKKILNEILNYMIEKLSIKNDVKSIFNSLTKFL